MAWKALNGMNVVWRSSLSRDLKIRFFRATVESILLYGSECWSLNSSSRKSLDGTYTRMLRTVLNINWRDHVPNVTLYGDLPRLTDRIAWRRLGIAGHCYRHREPPAQPARVMGANPRLAEAGKTCYHLPKHPTG